MIIKPDEIYQILKRNYGSLNWWPIDKSYHKKNNSDPRFEVIVGAILTQNTAWSNVEKALEKLKSKQMLDIQSIANSDIKDLAERIKSSGFFNQKAKRLKIISNYLKVEYNLNLDIFFNRAVDVIRADLLALNGIGPETADSILLYAGNKPVFVVDAYTKRLCDRLPLDTKTTYDAIQDYFQQKLAVKYNREELAEIFNELHAQIVIFSKEYCKKKPICTNCPLKRFCKFSKSFQ